MPVMAVNDENPHEQTGDYRSRPRWSAGKKTEAVLRLLRGESLEELSRELPVEAHRLAAWRDDFLEGGKDALKGQRPDRSADDRALRQAERKVGQLTWRTRSCGPPPKQGGSRSRRRSGPDSHGAPAAGGGGMSGARRAPLQHLRPSSCPAASPAWPGHLDQRPRSGRADPSGAGRLAFAGEATARSAPDVVASTASVSAASGSCGCCANRGCWRPSGSGVVVGHASMTGRSSLRRRMCVGAPMPPWPGPGSTAGCGCSPASTLHRRGVGAGGQGR
jgi:transposase-like protein